MTRHITPSRYVVRETRSVMWTPRGGPWAVVEFRASSYVGVVSTHETETAAHLAAAALNKEATG